ncbi:serine/threonine-protein kinase RIO1-like protein [Dinothrombium tinctorium]|uniref:Serine/threonine-protein kinase RIO1 n=1 Tax=Dinothrombium tinctorium TaxID=1965070 RepID=A0A443RFH4_9ACAR|nr:serine/threonine-protein kinase RIO1-like protein [Dinothrombium tinctorium]RWS03920.1 serine/threonine-protein kinase RIO1-like protein [Dinothrombium tinctorium]RWS14008.1 serine/threonine-protein kinase RIO1-like protein [Dinothrombium tinctorium]
MESRLGECTEGQFDDAESDDLSEEMRTQLELSDGDENICDEHDFAHDNDHVSNASLSGGKGEKLLSMYYNRINLDKLEPLTKLSHTAVNILNESDRKTFNERMRVKDKKDRATVEQVLDPRTRMILFKLLNKQIIDEINGCISTGKEANVYHATGNDGIEKAIKIYKTSILTFKDRDKYVTGEFRFRHGYCRHNPRKMVRTWAEKEFRNLSRIHQSGIHCPQPFLLKSHVLVMGFIGTNGLPAPLLKDVSLNDSKNRELYMQCILLMRRLFNDCKLVHADLSEFNLLYDDGKLCVIDVSQAVEHEHPRALDFLRKDCVNVTEYFKKKGVLTMSVKELFDFVTDPNINETNIDEYLQKAQEIAEKRAENSNEREKVDEEVFKQSFIPQRLDHVIDYEKDIIDVKSGQKEIIYKTITAMKPDLSGPALKPSLLISESESSECDESESECESESKSEDNDSNDEKKSRFVNSARPRDESPSSKKKRKQELKAERRAKREAKTPKHVKKRKEKLMKSQKRR